MKIAIVAHFMSENLGDRYQGTGVVRRLLSSFGNRQDVQLDCVNIFEGMESDPDYWPNVSTALNLTVYNIRKMELGDYDYVIMPSGSLNHESRFVTAGIIALQSQNLKRLYLWGGFTAVGDRARVIEEEKDLLRPLFENRRMHFFARSWYDFVAASMISSQDNVSIGGDPVLLYLPLPQRRNRTIPPHPKVPVIWNGNIISSDGIELFKEIGMLATRHVSVDPDEDSRIKVILGDVEIEDLHELGVFQDRCVQWRGVVTSRLHGGILAKRFNAQCPVLFVPTDLPAPFAASFKYHTAAATYEPVSPIADVALAFNIDLIRRFIYSPESFFSYEHEYHFLRYALQTELTMSKIVDDISSSA